jgi:hypothetical protein
MSQRVAFCWLYFPAICRDCRQLHAAWIRHMSQRNAYGVIDLCRRGECGIKILPVKLSHQFEADLTWNPPVKFATGEFACRLATDVDREGGSGRMKELLGVVVGKIIHKSGLSACNLRPISAATSRTCATSVLSSVSGMVKNCGACGSMAPPTTVDIITSSFDTKILVAESNNKAMLIHSRALPYEARLVMPLLSQ